MGWESDKKNRYMYMYNWITLLHTWNEHNIVNQLYSNVKFLKFDRNQKKY